MSQNTAPESQADADRLEAAADEAIAVCGGDVRAALKAMIVANEFLESEVSELMKSRFSRLCAREISHLFRLTVRNIMMFAETARRRPPD
jgi:hypothetical protein